MSCKCTREEAFRHIDLYAAEAQYHSVCTVNFSGKPIRVKYTANSNRGLPVSVCR